MADIFHCCSPVREMNGEKRDKYKGWERNNGGMRRYKCDKWKKGSHA
jgi:hypothetical protein